MADKKTKQIADNKLKTAYSNYYSSIYKFCLSRLKDDVTYVDDCVQETFLVLYNRLLSGEEFEYTQAYLFKTADNIIKKRYIQLKKDKQNINLEEVKEIVTHSVDIDDRLSFEEYSKMISDALSDTEKELFSMRYIEELKINDIAQRLNIPVTNVTSRLTRIRGKLKSLYDKYSSV